MLSKKLFIKEIPRLLTAGIISQETADKITDFYKSDDQKGSQILIIVFGVLGAVLLGSGIILILAHNWHELSRPLRTVISLTPLISAQVLCAYTLVRQTDSLAWREATAAFCTLSIGIAISLISQTYNIPGDLGSFLLTWVLLALPLVYIMRATFTAVLYTVGAVWWTGYSNTQGTYPAFFWLLLAALIPYFILLFRNDRHGIRFTLLSWVTAITVIISIEIILSPYTFITGATRGTIPGLSILAFGALYSLYTAIGTGPFYDNRSILTNGPYLIGAAAVPILSMILTEKFGWIKIMQFYHDYDFTYNSSLVVSIIIVVVLIAASLALVALRLYQKRYTVLPLGLMVLFSMIGYLIARSVMDPFANLIIFNIFTFILGLVPVLHGISTMKLGEVNYGLIIIALLIIIRFFDSDISFIIRGVVFITLGLAFFLVNYLIVRRKKVSS